VIRAMEGRQLRGGRTSCCPHWRTAPLLAEARIAARPRPARGGDPAVTRSALGRRRHARGHEPASEAQPVPRGRGGRRVWRARLAR
jgi:hypothetical protein